MRWSRALLICLTGLWFAGCGDRTTTGPEGAASSSVYASLPSGAYLDSAKLLLHTCHSDGQAVVVHPQQAPWQEASVTWNQIGPGLSPFVLATFRPHDTGWVRVDVTGLLQLWLDGIWANNGILLDQNAPEYLRTEFNSRESRARAPRLMLYFSVGASSTVYTFSASGDARIDAAYPTSNFGSDSVLQTGWTVAEPGERRTLLAFNLAEEEVPLSSVGDRVWLDANHNGVQDADEAGMADVPVQLRNCQGDVLAETVSDGAGHYLFDSLEAGSYVVSASLPAGFFFTRPDQGGSDQADSDVDSVSGHSSCFQLGEGVDLTSIDAGLVPEPEPEPRAAVGDRVWLDLNRDGLQDDLEPGVAGVAVTLHNCEQVLLATTFTDAEGLYRFSELAPGHYVLQFHKPDGLEFSLQVNGESAINSDADPASGLTECLELAAGEEDWTRDAGLHEPEPQPEPRSALGNRVWLDLNRNGVQDGGEAGVPGVGVVLLSCTDDVVMDTHTDASGQYRFDSLPAGSYRLRFVAPEGFYWVPAGATPDPELDSEADEAGQTECITLPAGRIDLSHDAGLAEPESEPSGCTRQRAFWKHHAGRKGEPDWVSPHLPIRLGAAGGINSVLISSADTAALVLNYSIWGGDANCITHLYAELLTARLNEAEGASTAAIQDVLTAVDAFLSAASWRDLPKLSQGHRLQALEWRARLADWNKGKTGPGACPEE